MFLEGGPSLLETAAFINPIQWVIITPGCGMLGFVGQTLLNSSFQMESAGLAATMQYVEIAFAVIWGVLCEFIAFSPSFSFHFPFVLAQFRSKRRQDL